MVREMRLTFAQPGLILQASREPIGRAVWLPPWSLLHVDVVRLPPAWALGGSALAARVLAHLHRVYEQIYRAVWLQPWSRL